MCYIFAVYNEGDSPEGSLEEKTFNTKDARYPLTMTASQNISEKRGMAFKKS